MNNLILLFAKIQKWAGGGGWNCSQNIFCIPIKKGGATYKRGTSKLGPLLK